MRDAMRWTLAVVAGIVVTGCNHRSQSTTGPEEPAVISGTPVVVASPTPVPTPTPTPAPVGCGLPPAGGSGSGCPYLAGAFNEDVDIAIAQAQKERPELFDFTNGYGMLSWRVLDRKKYYDAVSLNLEKMGYCVAHDEEEIGVKNVNRFNEQYQIMTSQGYSRWGPGAYRATCFPAWF